MASLTDFCETEQQRRVVEAYGRLGSSSKVGRELGMCDSSVRRSLARTRKRAAAHGFSPEHGLDTRGTPEDFPLSGYSHLTRNADGELIWLKASRDKASKLDAAQRFAERLQEGIPPLKPRPGPRGAADGDLLNLHTMTDVHLGMLAWPEETGAPWDTKIAAQMIVDWFADALRRSPKAAVGLLAELGDLLHFDGLETETPTSKHVLDADSRYQKVVDVVLDSMQRIIDMMLKKYPRVHIVVNDGNHDPAGSIWLRGHLRKMYERNPRLALVDNRVVTVDRSPSTFNAFEWGNTMLGFHHGHKVKPEQLTKVIAGMFREMYGRTKFAYGHSGHLHHLKQIEDQLMQWKQHPTIAAKDAFSARGGYLSQRMAFTTTYHREYGLWSEIVTTPEMLERAA